MTNQEFIEKIGEIAKADMIANGILASVTMAQAILESGYGTTDLATKASNYFGMKCILSGNTWASAWDGVSKYTKKTAEQKTDGTVYYVTADFRKYPDMDTSVRDHSLYLLGAKNGSKARYEGLKGEKDYKTAIQIIKDGGYATDINYVSKVCNIIERYNLTQYDVVEEVKTMKIIKSILTKNPCYTANRKITIKGLMLHSIGCPQPKASVLINDWNRSSYNNACVHGFIDAITGDIYQTLPWDHRGWHGGGSSNNTHIGVEMCEPACIKYTGGSSFTCSDLATAKAYVKRTYESAVELFAYLCKEYNLDPLNDIISHSEGYKKGIASNHGDPEHLWTGLKMGYTMDGFRKDVAKAMGSVKEETPKQETTKEMYRVRKSWEDVKSQIGAYTVLANAKAKADENPGYEVYDSAGKCVYSPKGSGDGTPFMVRVKIKDLNIRKGAGTNYEKVKYIEPGTYTITEVKSGTGSVKGWGKLKSGLGWISLDFVERV